MTNQKKINEIVDGLVEESRIDYIGLWQIVNRARRNFGLSNRDEIRNMTMEIIQKMLLRGFKAIEFAADSYAPIPWKNQDSQYVLNRISSDWNQLSQDPQPGDIVWFYIQHNSAAGE